MLGRLSKINSSLASKLENEKKFYVKRAPIPNIIEQFKPQFRINSLDRQNNDALKGNLLDTYKSATEIKPIPSATYSGSTTNIQDLKN
tara:strand:+ start:136 stop:399 length:264 start_codon:yes stop_codon:yes gene_type:complete